MTLLILLSGLLASQGAPPAPATAPTSAQAEPQPAGDTPPPPPPAARAAPSQDGPPPPPPAPRGRGPKAAPAAPQLAGDPPPPPPSASAEALAEARAALLGPCDPEQARGVVKAVSVVPGKAPGPKGAKGANPPVPAPALVFEYELDGTSGRDQRTISAALGLTTAQAQVLVGERLCVVRTR